MSDYQFKINTAKPQYEESAEPEPTTPDKARKMHVRRRIEDVQQEHDSWDALDEFEQEEEVPMDMKKLRTEIKGILKFEGVPLSRSELKQRFEEEGADINIKQFNNAIDVLVSSGEVVKKKDEKLGSNRYRYALSEQASNELPAVPESKVGSSVPEKEQQTAHEKVPCDEGVIKLDPAVFDELFMVFVPGSGMVAKVCEDLDEAKEKAKEVITAEGQATSIHRIYSEPLLECKPVTTIEFSEIV